MEQVWKRVEGVNWKGKSGRETFAVGRKRLKESGEQAIYLGTIIARDFAKAFVAIDNREVDDLSVRQEKTAVSCEQKKRTHGKVSSCFSHSFVQLELEEEFD